MSKRTGFEAGIAALADEIARGEEATNERFEGALDAAMAGDDPACVPALLGLLDDGFAYQHLMWALMHAAERFPTPVYVGGLVEALPGLDRRAPGWAELLTMRVLNGVRERPALADALDASPDPAVAAVRRLLARVAARNPELFAGKVYEVVSALRDPPEAA